MWADGSSSDLIALLNLYQVCTVNSVGFFLQYEKNTLIFRFGKRIKEIISSEIGKPNKIGVT